MTDAELRAIKVAAETLAPFVKGAYEGDRDACDDGFDFLTKDVPALIAEVERLNELVVMLRGM